MSVPHHSLRDPYAMHNAQAQQYACLAADDLGGALPHSDLELTTAQSNLPQHPQFPHQQAAQQSIEAETGAKGITSNQNQSRGGGRGTPLGRSGKGRGRGRHRVIIE